jgi:hypothetical protein
LRTCVYVVLPNPTWIIFYASAIHWAWGISLFVDGASRIAAWEVFISMPSILLGLMFISVACSAFYSILKRVSVLWMIPQQLVLMAMAFGQSKLIIAGHYADWVWRPPYFIYRDQVWGILLAVFHLLAMYIIHANQQIQKVCSKD